MLQSCAHRYRRSSATFVNNPPSDLIKEIWLWHGGAPLELSIHEDGGAVERCRLGMDIEGGERPQAVIPVGAWQAARSLGDWSLVSCTVAPAFEFAGFRMAPEGWEPGNK